MDFEGLRAFVAVADTGSLLGAAERLGWARPTLRRRLEELEARAGVPLVSRSSTGVVLTEAGVFLADRARMLIQESNAVLASVREVGAAPAGLVRVVLPVGLPPDLLLPLFARLRGRHPRLALSIRFADDPLHGLLDDVDVAVYFGGGHKGPWVRREIMRVREQLVASHAWRRTPSCGGARRTSARPRCRSELAEGSRSSPSSRAPTSICCDEPPGPAWASPMCPTPCSTRCSTRARSWFPCSATSSGVSARCGWQSRPRSPRSLASGRSSTRPTSSWRSRAR